MNGVFEKFIPFHLIENWKKCMIIIIIYSYDREAKQILQGSPCSVRTLLVIILVYEWQ